MIRLRALEPEDLDALYAIENTMEEWESGCNNVPFSRYALRDYIANNSYDIYADKQLRQVITDESNSVIGLIDLCNYDVRNQRAEVSVVVAKEYRNRGVATDALRLLVDYAASFLHIDVLYAVVAEANCNAVKLFERYRFECTATLKSWLKTKNGRTDVLLFQLFLKK